jgi:hypothetical protein
MRVRDHIAISTAAAAVSRRRLGRSAVLLWAGGVLIDFDHYVAFCLQEGRMNPIAAMRFYGRATVPEHWATRAFHSPAAVLAVFALGARMRPLRTVGIGMVLHIALDVAHEARMRNLRAAALERDRHDCQACGAHTSDVGTHVSQQPWLLPSYRPENVVSLCGPCHVLAHAPERSAA